MDTTSYTKEATTRARAAAELNTINYGTTEAAFNAVRATTDGDIHSVYRGLEDVVDVLLMRYVPAPLGNGDFADPDVNRFSCLLGLLEECLGEIPLNPEFWDTTVPAPAGPLLPARV